MALCVTGALITGESPTAAVLCGSDSPFLDTLARPRNASPRRWRNHNALLRLAALVQGPVVVPGSGEGGLFVEGSGGVIGDAATTKHMRGVVFLFCNCLCMAVFLTVQEPLLQRFPSPTLVTVWSYVFGAGSAPATLSFAGPRSPHLAPLSQATNTCRWHLSLLRPQGFWHSCWALRLGLGAAEGALLRASRG